MAELDRLGPRHRALVRPREYRLHHDLHLLALAEQAAPRARQAQLHGLAARSLEGGARQRQRGRLGGVLRAARRRVPGEFEGARGERREREREHPRLADLAQARTVLAVLELAPERRQDLRDGRRRRRFERRRERGFAAWRFASGRRERDRESVRAECFGRAFAVGRDDLARQRVALVEQRDQIRARVGCGDRRAVAKPLVGELRRRLAFPGPLLTSELVARRGGAGDGGPFEDLRRFTDHEHAGARGRHRGPFAVGRGDHARHLDAPVAAQHRERALFCSGHRVAVQRPAIGERGGRRRFHVPGEHVSVSPEPASRLLPGGPRAQAPCREPARCCC